MARNEQERLGLLALNLETLVGVAQLALGHYKNLNIPCQIKEEVAEIDSILRFIHGQILSIQTRIFQFSNRNSEDL